MRQQAEEAYSLRHKARIETRSMMSEFIDVLTIQMRDFFKYGNKDGPTFAWLVNQAKSRGLKGNAIYESIINGSQRTNASVDANAKSSYYRHGNYEE